MSAEMGALILFTDRLDEMTAFYRALGVPLEAETHEGGSVHLACDLGSVHFAVLAGSTGNAPPFRSGGGAMPGFAVPSLGVAWDRVRGLGARIVEEPTEYPWGPRFLVMDPDGRTVEVFERRGSERPAELKR
jgi:predicted enzyme related to lactoylglutathione lyase